MKFTKYRLGELGRIVTGKTPTTSNPALWNGDVQFVTPEELQRGKNILQTERHLTQQGVKSVCGAFIPAESVCVSCIGNIGYVAKTIYPCVTNQQINTIIPSGAHSSDFLYYKLKSIWHYFKLREGNATTIPILSKSDFANIAIHLPDLPTQLRIAGILGSLDEKIELNRKKIAELEALAKTIYDYWFVQFDFPDKNGKPYRSSGGKMVWNEQLKREIPAGWCNGKLSNIAYYASDKIQSNAIPLENYVTTDSMLQNKQGRDIATSLPPPGTSIVCFCESDTLVANIRPYLQKIWFSNVQGGCSQDVLVFRAKKSCVPTFLYSTLWQDNFFDYVMTGAKGSKMPRGDKDHIMSYPLALPMESLLSQYNKIVGDFWSRRNFALQQITELNALRDMLLPLLMNGQVIVK